MERTNSIIGAAHRFDNWAASGAAPAEEQWELLACVEESVRQWRYGQQPEEAVRSELVELSGRVRTRPLDATDEFGMQVRILLNCWPQRPLHEEPDSPALKVLRLEAHQLGHFFTHLQEREHEHDLHTFILRELTEVRVLSHCLHEKGRQDFILGILAQIEVFFERLSEAYQQIAQEVEDVQSLPIEQIDNLLFARLEAVPVEGGRKSEAEVVHQWYEDGLGREVGVNPLGRDAELDAWVKGELATAVHHVATTVLDKDFLTHLIENRLSQVNREFPAPKAAEPWDEAGTTRLVSCLSNLAVSGIHVVESGQRNITTWLVSTFRGTIGGAMSRRAQTLTPMLLTPGSLGTWAEILQPHAVNSMKLRAQEKVSVERAVQVTVDHVMEIQQQNTSLKSRIFLAMYPMSKVFPLMVRRVAEVPYYSKTMRELVVRYILKAI